MQVDENGVLTMEERIRIVNSRPLIDYNEPGVGYFVAQAQHTHDVNAVSGVLCVGDALEMQRAILKALKVNV